MLKESPIHIDPKLISAAVDSHPEMRDLREAVKTRFKTSDATAKSFAERLLTHAVERFGAKYLAEMTERISRLFERREQAAKIVDQVIGAEALTPEEAGRQLNQLFKDMKGDVDAISGPGDYAKNNKIPLPDKSELELTAHDDDPVKMPAKALPTGRHVEMLAVLKAKFKDLKLSWRKAMRKAADLAPNELWRAVASETEGGQKRNIEALKARAKARGMSDKEIASLEEAVKQLSLERARSQRLPGTAEATGRTEALQKLSPNLRKLVAGDRQLELLAGDNPEVLEEMFKASGAKSRSALRAYIRRRMVAHIRGMLGEFTAAFQLGEKLVLLKAPDYNVTLPGTDLVGVTRNGRVWLIDNKALSVEELGSVTALMKNLPENIADDTAAFKGEFGMGKDPLIGDAVARLDKATKAIQKLTKGLTQEQVSDPKIQQQIGTILRDNRIDRVITNAGGSVDGLSAGLKQALIRLENLNKPLKPKPTTK
ncbi:hypothetical protein [Fimbriimonas ginsengisoli]|uniref:Uncharacterized protein n=1 Tax=Fimbriimonas ginsengisoli Gsoil 348 TaxID=661478 RepID=A0A068NSH7_FIMGI|nr:hypothetical protein [Fimbriimonas ginsengisoli]AIE86493.1 hypothetical protein OP10G_3125 [Fimbriimonas ginsengisoli Gsoil 348]